MCYRLHFGYHSFSLELKTLDGRYTHTRENISARSTPTSNKLHLNSLLMLESHLQYVNPQYRIQKMQLQ